MPLADFSGSMLQDATAFGNALTKVLFEDKCRPVTLLAGFLALALIAVLLSTRSRRPAVYLMDFAVSKAPESWKMGRDAFVNLLGGQPQLSKEEIDFQDTVLQRSGLGLGETWATPAILSGDIKL